MLLIRLQLLRFLSRALSQGSATAEDSQGAARFAAKRSIMANPALLGARSHSATKPTRSALTASIRTALTQVDHVHHVALLQPRLVP
jgi:hypothetical protein